MSGSSSSNTAADDSDDGAMVPGEPVDETSIPEAPDRLFDSRLLEKYGIVDEALDRRLAPLAQLRCMQISDRVQSLLADARKYNQSSGAEASQARSLAERKESHTQDEAMLERILADVKVIRAGALKTKTVQAPSNLWFRTDYNDQVEKKVLIQENYDPNHVSNNDAVQNFRRAHTNAGMAVAPGSMNWQKANGGVMQQEEILQVVSAVNELIWKLDAAVQRIRSQKLPD